MILFLQLNLVPCHFCVSLLPLLVQVLPQVVGLVEIGLLLYLRTSLYSVSGVMSSFYNVEIQRFLVIIPVVDSCLLFWNVTVNLVRRHRSILNNNFHLSFRSLTIPTDQHPVNVLFQVQPVPNIIPRLIVMWTRRGPI